MNKKINKKGFTLAEALVAMLLVAIMAAGIIVALMSTKRAIVAPSNREEMLLAIEKVSSILQSASPSDGPICQSLDSANALAITTGCNQYSASARANCHNAFCFAPSSCQGDNDYFVYSVVSTSDNSASGLINQDERVISFMINCEGQTI